MFIGNTGIPSEIQTFMIMWDLHALKQSPTLLPRLKDPVVGESGWKDWKNLDELIHPGRLIHETKKKPVPTGALFSVVEIVVAAATAFALAFVTLA